MNRKVLIINEKNYYNRQGYMLQIPIVASFGDRPFIGTSYNQNFDGFITGYIKNADDILNVREIIADAKIENQKTFALIDPDFAKDGKLYEGITDAHIDNYKKLMELSDVITPNLSEACILSSFSYDEYKDKYSTITYNSGDEEKLNNMSKKIIESLFPLLDKMRFKKNQITILTGIKLYDSVVTLLDIYDGQHKKRQTSCNYSKKVDDREGSGAIFNTMFFESTINGLSFLDSLSTGTSFANNSLRFTNDKKYDVNEGIIYEPILHDNIVAIKERIKEVREEKKC